MLIKFVKEGPFTVLGGGIPLWDQNYNKNIGTIKTGELLFVLESNGDSNDKFLNVWVLTLDGKIGCSLIKPKEMQKP